MNDIEDRLRTDAAGWQQLVDTGARGSRPATPPVRFRRLLAPSVTAAFVLAIAVTLALVFRGGSQRPAPTGTMHWDSHAFRALALRYPAGWFALNPPNGYLGPEQPIGYVASQRDIVRCPADPRAFCDNPVPRLSGSATVISALSSSGAPHFTANATVDGRPAIFRRGVGCMPGATYGALIEFGLRGETIEVKGCTASTNPADRRVIDHILTTLRYTDRSAVTISGRVLVSGMSIHGPASGWVSVAGVADGGEVVIPVDRTGRYSAKVSAGKYVITGRATGIHVNCLRSKVTATHAITANVVCPIK